MWLPWPFDHTAFCPKIFPLFLLQRWLVNNNSPWLGLGPNQLGPRDVQPCPMFLSFVSYQIHKTKSLKNINVILTYSRPLMLQVFLEHQRGNTSPSSRLVSNPNFAQPGVPWGNIRHLSKFPEGWEENDSHCECRSMLPSQLSMYWVNEEQEIFGFWVGSESVTTCMTASWGH